MMGRPKKYNEEQRAQKTRMMLVDELTAIVGLKHVTDETKAAAVIEVMNSF